MTLLWQFHYGNANSMDVSGIVMALLQKLGVPQELYISQRNAAGDPDQRSMRNTGH